MMLMSIRHVAATLNVSVSTVQRLIRSGKLPSVKILKCRRVDESALRTLIQKGTSR